MAAFGQSVFKGSSGFGGASEESAPSFGYDIGSVLSAIRDNGVKDSATLATRLDLTPTKVAPILTELSEKGFLDTSKGLDLSESGERALAYSRMAKF